MNVLLGYVSLGGRVTHLYVDTRYHFVWSFHRNNVYFLQPVVLILIIKK